MDASRKRRLRRAELRATLLLFVALTVPGIGRAADPEWAAAGSFFLPGLGQAANGDYAEGSVHLGLSFVLAGSWLRRIERPDYLEPDEREIAGSNDIRINRTTADADLLGAALLNLSFYSAFAAYRDARAGPRYAAEYATPLPQESLTDLALAPFQWRYLSRPTTYAALLVPLFLVLSSADTDSVLYRREGIGKDELAGRLFLTHSMVGVGEEAFFRGFLNNGLSDRLGRYWGLAASSVLFGLGHSGDAGTATAAGATLFGAYLGWLQQENDYAIGQGVAIHFWWNFLASLSFLREREDARIMPLSIHLRF